ncbi:MAG: hypothetical protein COC19_04205 [SAR86 cluster bacterium]|uniref:DUF2975 domain-containing protein n=1 Tax=SAR86 cluster bacterium TaxID=2030880 RepID=A0A2A4MPK0_9GAMM|nr:MAG: hypothetical protein COC19_04205 [SAR86 cluster bacterium]
MSQTTSYTKRCAVTGALALVSMIIIAIVMTAAILEIMLGDYFKGEFSYHSLAPLAWLIPIAPCFAALNRLKNMLFRFAEGELFTHRNAEDIKYIASKAMITVVLMVFLVPGLYAVISYGWTGSWWIDLEPGDSGALLLASVLWLFGWLVAEGTKLQSENKGFI